VVRRRILTSEILYTIYIEQTPNDTTKPIVNHNNTFVHVSTRIRIFSFLSFSCRPSPVITLRQYSSPRQRQPPLPRTVHNFKFTDPLRHHIDPPIPFRSTHVAFYAVTSPSGRRSVVPPSFSPYHYHTSNSRLRVLTIRENDISYEVIRTDYIWPTPKYAFRVSFGRKTVICYPVISTIITILDISAR